MQNTQQPTKTEEKPRILIVEDDGAIADAYGKKFTQEGFEVTISIDGADALDKVKSFNPHIILLDLMLPEIDGFTVLEQVKSNASTKHIPVLVWTNKSETGDAQRALSLGATDYLVKVFNLPAEVVAKVRDLLEQQ